jgi:predicted phosphodiesterase
MRAVYRNIMCKGRSDKIQIIPIGDTHLGCKNNDTKKLIALVEYIRKTPQTYWIGMGDYVDSINYSDKRFDPKSTDYLSELDDISEAQIRELVKIFSPIKDRCLGLLGGNHEEKIRLRYHRDILSDICRRLNVDNLTYSMMMRVYFKRSTGRGASKNVVIFAHHGHGGGRAVSGKLNMVLSKAKSYDADIYLVGHCHLKANLDGERICMSHGRGEGRIYSKKQLFATTGSFMKSLGDGYSPYSEVAGYEPIPTGVIKITIEPFRAEHERVNGKHIMHESSPHIHMSV